MREGRPPMIIYPAIELLNGRPVNLNRGRIEEAQV
jgi:phosphoribosylformimino-5-aminoimidazole carboxamide ribonucleotide (ProFAR) isomerase